MSDSLPVLGAQRWSSICQRLQGTLAPHVFQSFVEPVQCDDLDETQIRLRFPDGFSKDSFEDKCLPALLEALDSMNLRNLDVALEVTDRKPWAPDPTAIEIQGRNPFDSKYTFETFVVGTSNQFAHAACQAVSQQPGLCYNPLFIFGGAGLGKTHLLKAIGHEICRQQEGVRVIFLTCEAFTNELIQAIRVDRMREFREKYRNHCDVLLLDDVHFLAGKERTQEEFFYTFNYLHESRRQIVITSDRYPKDIHGLEARLQTRFEWGLVADIQPPEIETRIAILKNKAEEQSIILNDEVAQFVASHITTNIRELEGCLHRLQAYATLSSVPISLELAQHIMKDLAPKIKHALTPDGILRLVALQFNIKTSDLKSDKRIRKLTVPRQISMYLLRKHLLMSYPEIGKFLGGKDHTTVLHGVQKLGDMLKTDTEILNYVSTIEGLIR